MPGFAPARCLTTPEQVLVNGANGICGEARLGQMPGNEANVLLFGVIAMVLAFALSRARSAGRSFGAVLGVAALLAASVGWWTALAVRADAPPHAAETAAHIASLVDRLDEFAWVRRECVETIHNTCVACEPLVRFAWPVHVSCAHAHGRVELRKGAISGSCTEHGDALDCGSSGSSAL